MKKCLFFYVERKQDGREVYDTAAGESPQQALEKARDRSIKLAQIVDQPPTKFTGKVCIIEGEGDKAHSVQVLPQRKAYGS